MRPTLLIVLPVLMMAGEARAQLTAPVTSTDPLPGGEMPTLPSQVVAERIRAALADPRNQALLDTLESALAGRGEVPVIPGDGKGKSLDLAIGTPRVEGLLPSSEMSSDARGDEIPVPSSASDAPSSNSDRDAESTVRGAVASAWTRVMQSRTAVLRVATDVRNRIAASDLAIAPYWIPVFLGLLLILGGAFAARRLATPPENRSLNRARKLSRRGVGAAEVARRTGISRELIQLIEARTDRKGAA